MIGFHASGFLFIQFTTPMCHPQSFYVVSFHCLIVWFLFLSVSLSFKAPPSRVIARSSLMVSTCVSLFALPFVFGLCLSLVLCQFVSVHFQ